MKIQVDIPESRIVDLLTSACEGGSGYWATTDRYPYSRCKTKCGTEYHLTLPVTVTDIDAGKDHKLTMASIKRGLELMLAKAPGHFGDFLSENDDAGTGDVFLQLCVLGDIVYG